MIEASSRGRRFNSSLLGVSSALSVIGLVNLYSATYIWGSTTASSLFYSQIMWMGIAWGLCLLIAFMDYQFLERFAYPLYALSLLGLLAVLLFGETISGHQSWIRIGSFHVQPSEFAKVGFLCAMAKHLASSDLSKRFGLREMRIPFVIVSLPIAFIIAEGDLGSALFFILCFVSLILFCGVHRTTFFYLCTVSVLSGFIGYFFFLSSYQKLRIQTFLQPGSDPKGHGYQIIQSKIAVGSGNFFGKGFMQGMQNKLQYLPERHTDFIFPVLAEEWGFLGALVVVLLYFALVLTGIRIASQARDRFGLFLAVGISALLFWQIVINIGGVLGLLPLTGVTLPILSYGGSSLLTTFIGIGMLFNLSSRRHIF
jgi:rod shape determining protein RodA